MRDLRFVIIANKKDIITVQKKLFNMGIKWYGGGQNALTSLGFEPKTCFYVYNGAYITYSDYSYYLKTKDRFITMETKVIKPEEIDNTLPVLLGL